MNTLRTLLALAHAYPEVSVPVVGGIVGLVFRLLFIRTAEEYAKLASMKPVWFWARFAAILQLIPTLFPDIYKAPGVITKVITGKEDTSKKP